MASKRSRREFLDTSVHSLDEEGEQEIVKRPRHVFKLNQSLFEQIPKGKEEGR